MVDPYILGVFYLRGRKKYRKNNIVLEFTTKRKDIIELLSPYNIGKGDFFRLVLDKNVYEDIEKIHINNIKSFLAGIFDVNGTIRVFVRKKGKKKEKVRNLRIVDKDIKKINNIFKMLSLLGINSNIYKMRNSFCLDIQGYYNIEKFLENVPLRNKRKVNILKNILLPLTFS